MTAVLVGLGSNLGNRQANVDRAIQLLATRADVRLIAASGLDATHPVGGPSGQADFLNAAAVFETSLEPAVFFAAMQEIETVLGRRRDGPRWSPRPIDLDLLLYGSLVDESPELTVPHPRMAFRRFVIEPAAEVAPTMVHPRIGWTLEELREHLRSARPYVAIGGAPGAGKAPLAADVSRSLGIQLVEDPIGQQLGRAPAGPAWGSEIELLELRSSRMAVAMAALKEHQPVVSDFWFDQALCFAELTLPTEQLQAYAQRWRTVAATMPRAKLLVLLDAPVAMLWKRVEAMQPLPAWLNLDSFARLRQVIVDRALAPGRGPLLRLDSRQPEQARIELAAAIEAMNG